MIWIYPEYTGQVAVRIGDLKVVRRGLKTKQPGPWELYDLSKDRAETENLAAKHPEVIRKAAAILRAANRDNAIFPVTIPETDS